MIELTNTKSASYAFTVVEYLKEHAPCQVGDVRKAWCDDDSDFAALTPKQQKSRVRAGIRLLESKDVLLKEGVKYALKDANLKIEVSESPSSDKEIHYVSDESQCDDVMIIVRETSNAGPCLMLGRLVSESEKFYTYRELHKGEMTGGKKRVAKSKVHIEPCSCCTDHPETQYPNGYMD